MDTNVVEVDIRTLLAPFFEFEVGDDAAISAFKLDTNESHCETVAAG